MEGQDTERNCWAMLVSLGGSPQPVLHTLSQQQPEYILFFVSAESAGQIQGIIRELLYQCRDFDCILSPSAEILGDCYLALRDQLPGKLAQWRLCIDDLMVDYTRRHQERVRRAGAGHHRACASLLLCRRSGAG